MQVTRPLAALSALGSAAAVAVLATPAGAAPAAYVALGDSYASGTGTRTYISDGTSCQRSVYAYPSLIAAARGYALTFRACSGARVSDVRNTQLSALTSGTAYVSLSVGGNDAGFTSVLTECALPAWMSNCNGKIDTALAYVNTTLPGSLATLYADIRSKAPNARVAVVGYPRIFMGEDCNALTWFSPTEEARLNSGVDQINAVIAKAAADKGFSFVNPTTAFTGHAVCDPVEWINGLSSPVSESYHPNRSGHSAGFTPIVSPRLTGATVSTSPALLAKATESTNRLTAQSRSFAAADAQIAPERFIAPDLTTARAKAAAARAGVDLSSRASIDRADAVWSARQAAAYARR